MTGGGGRLENIFIFRQDSVLEFLPDMGFWIFPQEWPLDFSLFLISSGYTPR